MGDDSQSKAINDIDEALSDFDLHGDDAELKAEGVTVNVINPALRALMDATIAAEKADAKANGWVAKAQREIDEHRRGIGKDDYNAQRRAAYYEQVMDATGAPPRAYEKATPERRQEQYRLSKAANRKAKRDAMTAEQIVADKAAAAKYERDRLVARKGSDIAALEDREDFGKF